jgi:hypothetical protein
VDHNPARSSFGFLFKNGRPISSKAAYQDYRSELYSAKAHHKFGIRFDVSSYFNSLYHHDLVNRFREIGASEDDVLIYGRFLREIQSGRSLDCLPHGLHPCKVLGADFLKFVDNSMRLTSPRMIRFLDDFNLFGDGERALHADFNCIQELLSEKGLFLNEGKTAYADDFGRSMTEKIDDIKAELLQARREVIDSSGIELSDFLTIIEDEDGDCEYGIGNAEDDDDLDESDLLTEDQTQYLLELLHQPDIDESDAELALVLLRDHGDEVLRRMGDFLIKFPGLSRTIYDFSAFAEDKTELCSLVLRFLRGNSLLPNISYSG